MNKGEKLKDIVVIRVILIVLLVLYHSFAIFNGAWESPVHLNLNTPAYWWIASLSYSFMLETFVFISGYILGYQESFKGLNIYTFQNLVLKKGKRLLLPSISFSIIYYVIFFDFDNSGIEILYSILNGCGHLWFLPMLFWCFILMFLLHKIGIKNKKVIFYFSIFISLFSIVPFPFRLTNTMYYFFFFFMGYCMSFKKNIICYFIKLKYIFVSILCFGFLFYYTKSHDILLISNELSVTKRLVTNFTRLICSISGVIMLYLMVNFFLKYKIISVNSFLIRVGSYCFGIYIFQQFILKFLYYKTALPLVINIWLLPWICFIITLGLSFILCYYFVKTKVGKLLIG